MGGAGIKSKGFHYTQLRAICGEQDTQNRGRVWAASKAQAESDVVLALIDAQAFSLAGFPAVRLAQDRASVRTGTPSTRPAS
jgi:hypothetical protein